MKKVFNILVITVLSLMLVFNVNAKEEDTVYIHVFYTEWCPNCQNLHKFLNELSEDKNYNKMFEIKYYRLDNESKYGVNAEFEQNKELFGKVRTYYDEIDDSIPLYFIGDTYNVGFYPETSPNEIKKLIKDNYYSKHNDVIQDIIDGKIDVKNDNPHEKKELNNTKIIGIVVFAATIILAIVIIAIYLKNR